MPRRGAFNSTLKPLLTSMVLPLSRSSRYRGAETPKGGANGINRWIHKTAYICVGYMPINFVFEEIEVMPQERERLLLQEQLSQQVWQQRQLQRLSLPLLLL